MIRSARDWAYESGSNKLKSGGRPIFGIFLIAIGAIFLVDTMDLIDTNILSYVWPILLILLGGSAFRKGRKANTGSLLVLTLGVILLIGNISDDVDFGNLWPVMLIVLGLNAIFNFGRRRSRS